MEDIGAFTRGMYSKDALPIEYVKKIPNEMPHDAPYVSYQGRNGSPPKEIIWVAMPVQSSSQMESTSAQSSDQLSWIHDKEMEAYVAAVALALMDAGRAGDVLQAVYAKTPPSRVARLDLGISVARAFAAASDQIAAKAASQADWIKTRLVAGVKREAAYALLKPQGFVAYNMAYVKVKAEATENPSPGTTFVRCDNTTDRASANWPYRNEPLPKVEEGSCADLQRLMSGTFTPEPDAHVVLDGAFSVIPTCGCHTEITITFDSDDRVSSVKIDKPRCPCV